MHHNQTDYGQLVPKTTRTQDNLYLRQLVPRTTRSQDNLNPGQLVPKTTRTQDNSYPRELLPKITRTQDNSSCPGYELSWVRAVQIPESIRVYYLMVASVAPTRWRHQRKIFSRIGPLWGKNHQSPVDSPHKGQWREALMCSLTCTWSNGWANNRDAGDLRRHQAYSDVTVMKVDK